MVNGHVQGLNAFGSYAIVAFCGGLASVLIALIGMKSFTQITDVAMVCIAVMAVVPAGMAVGVAYFIHRTSAIQQARRAEPNAAADGGGM